MKLRSTIIVSLVAIVALISLSTILALSLFVETEERFQQLAGELPVGNQTANLNQLSLGQALIVSLYDGSQTQMRAVLLEAADETLTDSPTTAPTLIILVAGVAGAIGIGVYISLKIYRPLQRLLLVTRALARGQYDDAALDAFKSGKVPTGKNSDAIRRAVHDLNKDELSQLYAVLGDINQKLLDQQSDLKQSNETLSIKNKELAEANEKLKALDRMKTDFINIAAHELKTPLQPLLGCIGLVKNGALSYEEGWKTVENQSKILKHLAESILDVSRIENGILSYNMKPLDVTALIETVASSFSVISSGVKMETISTPGQNCMVLGDEKRLIQVLSNLIGNSLKFTKTGAILISAQTVTHGEDGQVELKIKDTGRGIPSDILPILFNKFVTKNTSHGGGTGLGLFIAKSIVEAHGGDIKAENNADGVGATFTITMPLLKQLDKMPYQDGAKSKSEQAASA